jgi:tRNA pseudouridine55 synthase
MHAAIKVGGRKLYELARRGEEIPRAARAVTIHRLELVDWAPPTATLIVDCSKGTYIRALARDLGAELGTGAYLSNLVRLRSGPFHLCQTLTLEEVAESVLPWSWPRIAVHPDAPVLGWPALVLDASTARRWRQGSVIAPDSGVATGPVRAYDAEGDWLGTGNADPGTFAWRPHKVVAAGAAA